MRQLAVVRVRMRLLLGAVLAILVCTLAGGAGAVPSTSVVISQVYGGGGNSGATYKQDFIELHNLGTTTVDLSAWSVQYASTIGTTWQRTNLSGSLAPGQYYLVQEAQGAGGTVDLPTPDATGTIPMSATAGKVVLVNSQTTIATGTSCPVDPTIVDVVGYGTGTNCFEGSGPTGTTNNTTAALRVSGGCADTDNNPTDFLVGAPTPRNTASPVNTCEGDVAPTISSKTPDNGATGVAVNSNVSITFSEPVNVSGSWYAISCGTSGNHTATVSGGPTTFTIDPDADFAFGETCSVLVIGAQVSDQDTDDPPDTMAGNQSWTFGTAAAPQVVVSQVYGGGGNSGALFKNDFIELYNRGSSSVSLSGWSVQYASSAGTTWQVTPLTSFTLLPGRYYLVQEAQGAAGTVDLPTPDATGTIPMSATSGKVALVNTTTALSGGCPTGAAIMDFAGYGSAATCFEGSGPTGTLSNTTAALRKNGGATDTNDNAADFDVGAPNPRNSSDQAPAVISRNPAAGAGDVAVDSNITIGFSEPVTVTDTWYSISCSSSGSHTAAVSGGPQSFTLNPDSDFVQSENCTVTVFAANVTDQDANDPPDNMAANDSWTFATVAPLTPIHTIQGATHTSPLATQTVTTSGIVTSKRSNGYYLQDPNPDADDATSEGIFVFTSSSPSSVNVSDSVRVSGTVAEFRPGGAGSNNLATTELTTPTTTVLTTGNPLPATTVIGVGGRLPPTEVIENDAVSGSVETSGSFDSAQDGIDFYESLEGMLVQVNNPVVVGPRSSFGEIFVLGDNGAGAAARTARGGIVIRDLDAPFDYESGDFNPERIQLDDAAGVPTPNVHVGDGFTGPAIGVLDYDFGNFEIEVTSALTRVDNGLARETTDAPGARELSVATFNVENLDANEPQSKFDALAGQIVNNMRSPDVVSLEEIQDNNGPTNDSVVDADQTLSKLVAAIQTAGGPTYDWRQINPVDDQDGGEPGGNIRVGFIFRADRGLAFVDRPGGGSTTPTTVISGPDGPQLSSSPGRVDPTNSAWNASRKPLAGEFTYRGETFFLITNHFNSKGGDQPLFGRFQPPTRTTELQRHQQAQIVNNFVDSILTADANANVVVLGDLNDFEFSQTVSLVEGGVMHALMKTLPQNERYSYVFEGNSQSLDHIVVSDSLFGNPFAYDPVHVNAEFFDQLSDHDPQVARFLVDSAPSVDGGGPYAVNEGGSVNLSATGLDPNGDSLTYAWDLDNNGTYETAGQTVTFSAGDGPASPVVGVRATDGIGSSTDTATVNVSNLPPTATFSAPAQVFAGFPCTLSLSGASDASTADIGAGFQYAFDRGSGYGSFGTATSASCTATDTGVLSVGGKIRDKDLDVSEYRATVNVVVTFASLCDLVEMYTNDAKTINQLCQRLELARTARNEAVKQAQLRNFRTEVDKARADGFFTADEAATLKRLSTRL